MSQIISRQMELRSIIIIIIITIIIMQQQLTRYDLCT